MTPHFTPSPFQGHLGSFQFHCHSISTTVSICVWERSGIAGSEGPDHLASPSTFQSPERVPAPACGLTPSSFSPWHFGNRCLKLNLCSAGCLSVARLNFSSVPPAPLPPARAQGRRKELFEQGSQHQQTPSPLHSSLTMRPRLSRSPGLSQHVRGCRDRAGAAGERTEVQQTPAFIWALTWSPSLYLTPTWHHWPQRTRADKVTLLGGASSRLSLGAWPWGLDRGQRGLGHYLSNSLDFGSLKGVFLLISHCMVRSQICEAAGSHFRTHLLTGGDERIFLAAQGILSSPLFPPAMACCHFHLA